MRIVIVLISSLMLSLVNGQNKENKWLIGVGMHGPQFTIKDEFFFTQNWKLKDWNITPPISKLSLSRHLVGGISPELSYSIAKVAMDPKVDKSEMLFMNIDLNFRYSFANGYILKSSSSKKITESVKDVIEGGSPLTPIIASKILQHFPKKTLYNEMEMLSKKEKEVLDWMVKGYSYKMIAAQLDKSVETIRTQVKHIYKKLNVQSNAEAILRALNKN